MPWCDTDAMAAHLMACGEISAAVDPGAHAVLIVDQAGWHLTPKLAIPDNITVLALPPRSPELNPVENVWQFMRDNWLSNRIFKSYEDIVALCCRAWNNLIDQPWKIMSLGMRKWVAWVLINDRGWYDPSRQHPRDERRQLSSGPKPGPQRHRHQLGSGQIGPRGPKRPGTRQLYRERRHLGALRIPGARFRHPQVANICSATWPVFAPPLTHQTRLHQTRYTTAQRQG